MSIHFVDTEISSEPLKYDAVGMGVYIVQCADGTLYTGATKDIVRRIAEHNDRPIGAKYTKIRRPVILVFFEATDTWSEACKREHAIKLCSRKQKLELIAKHG